MNNAKISIFFKIYCNIQLNSTLKNSAKLSLCSYHNVMFLVSFDFLEAAILIKPANTYAEFITLIINNTSSFQLNKDEIKSIVYKLPNGKQIIVQNDVALEIMKKIKNKKQMIEVRVNTSRQAPLVINRAKSSCKKKIDFNQDNFQYKLILYDDNKTIIDDSLEH